MQKKDSLLWALRDRTKKPDALGFIPFDQELLKQLGFGKAKP